MNSVLQAGHWKSLKTSMTIGAFLEPAVTWGSISGTAANDWPALTPSAGQNSSAKRQARLAASKLAFRERFTQSSVTVLDITQSKKNITCDSRRNEASSQPMCAVNASPLLYRMRAALGALVSGAACAEVTSMSPGKEKTRPTGWETGARHCS